MSCSLQQTIGVAIHPRGRPSLDSTTLHSDQCANYDRLLYIFHVVQGLYSHETFGFMVIMPRRAFAYLLTTLLIFLSQAIAVRQGTKGHEKVRGLPRYFLSKIFFTQDNADEFCYTVNQRLARGDKRTARYIQGELPAVWVRNLRVFPENMPEGVTFLYRERDLCCMARFEGILCNRINCEILAPALCRE